MAKWLNVELNVDDATKFRQYLSDNGIKYETSGADNLVHFEVLADKEQAQKCNKFLEEVL